MSTDTEATHEAATREAVEQLPTVEDDARVKALRDSLDQLATDQEEAAEALKTARAELEKAEAYAEDLEIEQYADPDVTESDVDAAQERHAHAREEVDRLEAKAEHLEEAATRVRKRIKAEREDAGIRLAEQYRQVLLATSHRAAEALEAAAEALDVMNTARRKSKANNVGGHEVGFPTGKPFEGRPFDAKNRRVKPDVEEIMHAAVGVARAPIERLSDPAPVE